MTTAIIQARMGSNRLPGKVLYPLGKENKPALVHLVERVKRAKHVHQILIVTTDNPEDNIIEEYAHMTGCLVWRGDKPYVLENIIDACIVYSIGFIVDITADCPLIDPRQIDEMMYAFIHKPNWITYVSNVDPRSFPRGFDIQIYDRTSLISAYNSIQDDKHKNHSGWNIMIREKPSTMIGFTYKENLSNWRLCIDEQDDYELMRIIFNRFPDNKFSYKDVIKFLKRFPNLLHINMNVKQKVAGEG